MWRSTCAKLPFGGSRYWCPYLVSCVTPTTPNGGGRLVGGCDQLSKVRRWYHCTLERDAVMRRNHARLYVNPQLSSFFLAGLKRQEADLPSAVNQSHLVRPELTQMVFMCHVVRPSQKVSTIEPFSATCNMQGQLRVLSGARPLNLCKMHSMQVPSWDDHHLQLQIASA